MKLNKLFILLATVGLGLTACKKDFMPDGDPAFAGTFRPFGLTAESVNNSPTTKITFNMITGVTKYVVGFSSDTLNFDNGILSTDTIDITKIPDYDPSKNVLSITYANMLAGNTRYAIGAKSVATKDGLGHSKWGSIIYTTPKENIFFSFLKVNGVTNVGEVTVNWTPGTNVSDIRLLGTDSVEISKVAVTAAEIIAGKKVISNIARNKDYIVQAMLKSGVRGVQNIRVEGDVLVANGGDLTAAISSATDGQIILVGAGTSTGTGKAVIPAGTTLKLKGIAGTAKPVIDINGGGELFEVPAAGINSFSLENLDLKCNNNGAGYLFNAQSNGAVDIFSVNDCIVHDMRGIVRMRNTGVWNNIIFNNSVFYNIGNYFMLVCENNSVVKNYQITNSTGYNVYGIARYNNGAKGADCKYTISDCTFNAFAAGGYVIRIDVSAIGEMNLTNTVFGAVAAPGIDGITAAKGSLTVTNSFRTGDFIDVGASGTGKNVFSGLSPYSGNATDLFVDPANGNFAFKDANFSGKLTAGDPRWK